MIDLQVRDMVKEDIISVMELFGFDTNDEKKIKLFEELVDDKTTVMKVLEADNGIIAFGAVDVSEVECAYINQIIVNDKYRNRGFGKKMVKVLTGAALCMLGRNIVFVCVGFDEICAIKIFQSVGYKILMKNTETNELIMSVDLSQKLVGNSKKYD